MRAASQIAQGNYQEVTALAATEPAAPGMLARTSLEPQVETTEVSNQVHTSLVRAFSRFAGTLQRREQELGAAGGN
jgi:hypothetical protein